MSVKKPYTVIVAVAIIMILGAAALFGIRTDLLPDVDYPYAVVVTDYEDASPEEVESTVTKPIEKALASVGKVEGIHSVSTQGRSIVTVEFDSSANMDSVVAEMREVFEPLRSEWSSSVSSPMIRKINPDSMPVMVASVDVEGEDAAGISKFVEDTLMTYFDGIDGVADLSVVGLVSEQVQITIDPDKLAKVNEEIFNAIDGDYAKTRAALEATDAELSNASAQRSSTLLNETASIDAQLRTLNQQLAKARAEESSQNSQIKELRDEVSQLESEVAALKEKTELTEEEEEKLSQLESDLTAARSKLAAAESSAGGSSSDIASLNKQISELESRRSALTSQMSSSEAELAKSRSEITKQLSDLADAEETAKAEADLKTLLTTEMVSTMLDAQNFSSTAGSLALGNKEYDVKVGDEISSVEELQNLVLFHFDLDGVDDVLLSDVANVSLVNDSGEIYSKIDGHDGVLISFMKQSDASTSETAKNINETFDRITETYPSVTITPLSDQSVYIDRVSKSVSENLIIGAVLAVLVLLLFLRDLRPTLVVAVSIPVSLLFAVALMYFTGVTLNIFSLSGLALGVGMLVDNSIVVMENIYRCREIGLARHDAAVEGAKQVAAAIVASTLTTICVFLPVVFTDGISRELFADIGLTITYALLASLFVAFTLVPALSSGVLRKMDGHRENGVHPIKEKYTTVLRWVLCHRVFIIFFSLLLLVFSAVFAFARGTSFLPQSDSSEMTLTVTMEEDTRQEVLWQTTDEVVSLLQNIGDVKSVGAVCDDGGTISMSGVSEGNSTTIYVVLNEDKNLSCRELEDLILAQTENLGCHIDISIGSYDLSSLYEDGITITVSGSDLSTLADITSDMGELLLSVEGVENVKSSMDTATPTLRVSVNKTEAMKYGLTVSEVYEFISRSISNSANATTLSQSGTDVIVIDGSAGDLTLADIQNLKMTVTDDDGISSEVVIGSIATISEEEGAPVIYRDDQARYMTATADIADGYNVGLVSEEINELVSGYTPPEGYRIAVSGEESVISGSMKDLLFMMGLALLLMYLIMVAQFQSLLTPMVIMTTVPLAFTGGFLALLVSGRDISVIAVVGFLLLSGIVVNNGIVLVDYVNRLRKSGKTLTEAFTEGCCTRMRPIVMTATTTVLAVITLAFGLGMGAEVVQPMAIVVFGGMLWATVVTLFVTPAVYDLLLRRKADTIAEYAQGYPLNDPEEKISFRMEKRDEAVVPVLTASAETDVEDKEKEEEEPKASSEKKPGFLKRLIAGFDKEDDDEDEDGDDEDEDGDDEEEYEEEEEESSGFRFFRRFRSDDEEDEEDEDEEDEATEKPRFRLFHRHPKDETEEESADDDDDDDDEEDDEKPRFRFFRRFRNDSDEEDEEDDDDDEEDDEEDDAVESRFRFRLPFFRRREEDEDEEDEDDDDYYGLKERRRYSDDAHLIDAETRRRVLRIPENDSFTEAKEAMDKNENAR